MTILNAVCGALPRITYSPGVDRHRPPRLVALLAALFHLACNFVLFLAIINEDIMPSYTCSGGDGAGAPCGSPGRRRPAWSCVSCCSRSPGCANGG